MVAEPKNCKYKTSMKRVGGHSIVIKYMMYAEFQFHMNLDYALWHFLWDSYCEAADTLHCPCDYEKQ